MADKMTALVLNGRDLTPALVAEVACNGRPIALEGAARARMAEARAIVERHLDENRPVYGLTTGLGSRVVHRLPREVLSEFSRLTVRGRSHALGPRLPVEVVRAIMTVRLNGLLIGGAGASPAVAEAIADLLNAGLHPVMPSIGSIGAGDLCLLAHIGLALMGEGEIESGGAVMAAGKALAKAGLRPLELGPKDGLAICNASSGSAGMEALGLRQMEQIWALANVSAALSMEGFRANVSPLDERLAALRPQPGQAEASAALRALLGGGGLLAPGAARRLQDPLSLRCVAQVHGALRATLDFTAPVLAAELNGDASNPAVLISDDAILSNGNFHTPLLAIAFDAVALACAQAAQLCLARTSKHLLARLSELPAHLSPHGPTRSGFAPVLKPVEALVAEIEHLALPVRGGLSLSADGVEDHMTHAPQAVHKLMEIVWRLRLVLAAELIVAAQAVEMRGIDKLGAGTGRAFDAVRAMVAPLDDDRPLAPDIERVDAELLANGILLERISGSGPSK